MSVPCKERGGGEVRAPRAALLRLSHAAFTRPIQPQSVVHSLSGSSLPELAISDKAVQSHKIIHVQCWCFPWPAVLMYLERRCGLTPTVWNYIYIYILQFNAWVANYIMIMFYTGHEVTLGKKKQKKNYMTITTAITFLTVQSTI